VFDQQELQLNVNDLQGNQRMFPSDASQNATWTVNMTIDDLWKMQSDGKITTPVQSTEGDPIDPTTSAQKANFIFIKAETFKAYFASYTDDGKAVTEQDKADVSR
jgi:hypothetical protein